MLVDVRDPGRVPNPGAVLAGQLVRIFLVVRVGALAEAVATGWGNLPWLTNPGRAWVVAAFAAENLAMFVIVVRKRRIRTALLVFDAATLAATTAAVALLSGDRGSWENWPFTYATVATFGIGAVCRSGRLFSVLLGTWTALYCWLEFLVIGEKLIPGGIDMLTVVLNLLIGFGAGRSLDRRVAELAALHAASVRQAEARGRLAEDRRADVTIRQGAVRVLQRLVQSPSLDEGFKRYIAKESSDLAALTGAGQADGAAATSHSPNVPDPSAAAELIVGVEALPDAYPHRTGTLDIEVVVTDTASRAVLPAGAAAAMLGAVRESVNNAVKHSRSERISVRVRFSAEGIEAAVTDTGTGFDAATVARGFGLTGSVEDRLAAVGGRALIDSAPGRGTCVRLSVPHQRADEQDAEGGGPA